MAIMHGQTSMHGRDRNMSKHLARGCHQHPYQGGVGRSIRLGWCEHPPQQRCGRLLACLWGRADPGGRGHQGGSCVASLGVGLMLLSTAVSSTDCKEEVSSVHARAAEQGLQGAVGGFPLNGTLLGLASLPQTSVPAKKFPKAPFSGGGITFFPFQKQNSKTDLCGIQPVGLSIQHCCDFSEMNQTWQRLHTPQLCLLRGEDMPLPCLASRDSPPRERR